MQGDRIDRVESLVQDTLSEIIRRDVKDPRVEWATITRVKVSPDLRIARVSVSTIHGEEHLHNMLVALNKMSNFLQNKLNDQIRMKFIPKLYFYPDRNIPYSIAINEKLSAMFPDIPEEVEEEENEEQSDI